MAENLEQEFENEAGLRQERAQGQRERSGPLRSVLVAGGSKMDGVDLGLGLVVAGFFDVVGAFIPFISSMGVGLLWFWLWLKGVSGVGAIGGVGAGVELIPVVNWLPACLAFVVMAYLKDKSAIKLPVKISAK